MVTGWGKQNCLQKKNVQLLIRPHEMPEFMGGCGERWRVTGREKRPKYVGVLYLQTSF
jgi:hypothetical protein